LLPFIVFLHAKNNLHDLGRNQKYSKREKLYKGYEDNPLAV
jgi:hypothetical protein